MMRYPIDVKPDGKFFLVTFPDIPEAITQGRNSKEAKEAAASALETALDFYFENFRVVPNPSRIKRGQDFIELPASVSAKVLLLNEMIRQRIRPAELARRMQTTPQEVNRLTNLRHTSKIDGIAGAMKALGKTLEIRAV
jgi:antitoxin HicB